VSAGVPSPEAQRAAREALPTLLAPRLEPADLPPGGGPPDLVVAPAGEPERRPDGLFEVPFSVEARFSTARVELLAETGALVSWTVDRFAEAPRAQAPRGGTGVSHRYRKGAGGRAEPAATSAPAPLTDDDAIGLAIAALGPLPAGACLEGVDRTDLGEGKVSVGVRWRREHEGIRVEGDALAAEVALASRRAWTVYRAWRPGPFPAPSGPAE